MIRAALAALLLATTPAGAGCRLALVLGLDVSSSVNSREYDIQLQGLARAFRVPEVRAALLTPPGAWVAVTAFEWSGSGHQVTIADWTLLDSPGAIDAFSAQLSRHIRSRNDQPTGIGEALRFAAQRFAAGPACARRTVDLSGDGANNDGPTPNFYRSQGLLEGLTINGLVVQGAADAPEIFYREQVMQGPNAFVALARDFDDYPAVIIGKLLREVTADLIVGGLGAEAGP
ncbi:MAG: DUF1194 domain-containing protein [Pikeienuella sp.]